MWWIASGIIAAIVILRLIIDTTGAEVKITSGQIPHDVFHRTDPCQSLRDTSLSVAPKDD